MGTETRTHCPLLADVLPELKVMLVFASVDHVQVAVDKPHIHQAYDGFHHTAGLWCRLNPDLAYVESLAKPGNAFPDNTANTEPSDWMNARAWGYRAPQGSHLNTLAPLAALTQDGPVPFLPSALSTPLRDSYGAKQDPSPRE